MEGLEGGGGRGPAGRVTKNRRRAFSFLVVFFSRRGPPCALHTHTHTQRAVHARVRGGDTNRSPNAHAPPTRLLMPRPSRVRRALTTAAAVAAGATVAYWAYQWW